MVVVFNLTPSYGGRKNTLKFPYFNLLLFLQAYSGTPPEEKEKIVWVRFENADLNGMASFSLTCSCGFWVHVQ